MYRIIQTLYLNRRLWRLTIYDSRFDLVGIYSIYLPPDSDVINVPPQRHISIHADHKDMWIPIIKNFDGKTPVEIKEYLGLLVLVHQDWVLKTEELQQ